MGKPKCKDQRIFRSPRISVQRTKSLRHGVQSIFILYPNTMSENGRVKNDVKWTVQNNQEWTAGKIENKDSIDNRNLRLEWGTRVGDLGWKTRYQGLGLGFNNVFIGSLVTNQGNLGTPDKRQSHIQLVTQTIVLLETSWCRFKIKWTR